MPKDNIPNNLPIQGKNLLDNVNQAEVKNNAEDVSVQKGASLEVKPNNPETEDIFSDVAEAPLTNKRSLGNTDAGMPEKGSDIPQELAFLETPHQGFKKVLITILSIIVMAGLLTGGGYWVYVQFLRPTPLNPNLNINFNNLPATQTNQQVEEQTPAVPLDSDNDGLSDDQEAQLGTDPRNPDTDGDRLFDREEVEVYKTDPLNKDTDGDTYEDGSEVQGGYDPKGPGKLIRIPAGE